MLVFHWRIDMHGRTTSMGEFAVIEEFVRRIEDDFELATEDDLDSIGTEMGLLPMVKGNMGYLNF